VKLTRFISFVHVPVPLYDCTSPHFVVNRNRRNVSSIKLWGAISQGITTIHLFSIAQLIKDKKTN
jgi:hypothetical protein